jgi:hypothetical protein
MRLCVATLGDVDHNVTITPVGPQPRKCKALLPAADVTAPIGSWQFGNNQAILTGPFALATSNLLSAGGNVLMATDPLDVNFFSPGAAARITGIAEYKTGCH